MLKLTEVVESVASYTDAAYDLVHVMRIVGNLSSACEEEVGAPDLVRALWQMAHAGGRCPDFIQEVRFVAGDTAALSPAHGRDSVYLGAYCTNPAVAAGYHADLLALARQAGGRPHWGKRFDHTTGELAPLYPRWADFQALRARLDPQGTFRTAWHDRVLGPVG